MLEYAEHLANELVELLEMHANVLKKEFQIETIAVTFEFPKKAWSKV
jgi:hypothetical protein